MSHSIMKNDEPRFGLNVSPKDLILPLTLSTMLFRGYPRGQVVTKRNENIGFEVTVDVKQFLPEEITVKVIDKSLIVEAKHDELPDQHGYVSRQFTRRYVIPDDCHLDHVTSTLSSDGILSVTVPKLEAVKTDERIIPVIHKGAPHGHNLLTPECCIQ